MSNQQVVGPRGGVHDAEVSCLTCVCDPNRCGYCGPITKAMGHGCPDWASRDRERIHTATIAEPGPAIEPEPEQQQEGA